MSHAENGEDEVEHVDTLRPVKPKLTAQLQSGHASADPAGHEVRSSPTASSRQSSVHQETSGHDREQSIAGASSKPSSDSVDISSAGRGTTQHQKSSVVQSSAKASAAHDIPTSSSVAHSGSHDRSKTPRLEIVTHSSLSLLSLLL